MINSHSKGSSRTAEILNGAKAITGDEVEEASNFNYAVAANRWSMKILGLWPLDPKFSNLKCTVSFMLVFILTLPAVIHLFTMTDWEAAINQANLTIVHLLSLMRFIFVRANTDNLRAILHRMNTDWTNYYYLSKRDQQSMIYYARKGRLLNAISIIGMVLSFAVYLLTPLLNTKMHGLPWNVTNRALPIEGSYPFPSKQSPIFEILYIAQSFVGCISGMVMFSVDCFLCKVVFHACGQLDILATILKRYNGTIRHVYRKNPSFNTCACLSCIVKRHVHIISYMDIVQRSFSRFVLFVLIAITFILTLQGYKIVTYVRDNNINGFITFILYGMTSTYGVFIFCYVGECIIEKSENIGKVAYNLKWNYFPRNYALPIVLLIIRSRKPCRITAGRFATMCFSLYTNILMTSISYISVLKAVK